jgi:putative tryptophan/tyrosine transport system substrate-binding protein
MKRTFFIWLLATFLLVTASLVQAQQPKKVPRIGLLSPLDTATESPTLEAFRLGLRELGYVEGKNIEIEYRYAEGKLNRLPELGAELARLRVDVIVTRGSTGVKAAKEATNTIPIVVGSAGDLVGEGFVASLARPGGNITGSTNIAPDLSGKRLELLIEAVPKTSPVAVLFYSNPGSWDEVKATQAAARGLGVRLQLAEVKDPNEIQNAYAAITKQKAHALIIVQTAFTRVRQRELVELATKHRLPSLCEQSDWTTVGCLMSYGADLLYPWRRAHYVDTILKGAKPADLPVEQPKKFELVINLKTAKQIGLTIPPNVLARADKVIK